MMSSGFIVPRETSVSKPTSTPLSSHKHHDELVPRETRPSANQRRHLCHYTNTTMNSGFIVPREKPPSANQRRHLCHHTNTMMSSGFIVPRETRPSANQRRHFCHHTNTTMSSGFIVPRETLRQPTNVDTSVITQTP